MTWGLHKRRQRERRGHAEAVGESGGVWWSKLSYGLIILQFEILMFLNEE